MHWYLDLLSFLLEKPVGIVPAIGITMFGWIANLAVVAFLRYVDNWEYGMDRRELAEALVWGAFCLALPGVLFALAVVGLLGAVVTGPIWYPFKLYLDQQRRDARSEEFQREQERKADPARVAANSELDRLEQVPSRQPTQAIHS